MIRQILVWDLGATKCAAALMHYDVNEGMFACERDIRLQLRDYQTLVELMHALEKKLQFKLKEADAVCIGAAGMYDGNELQLANGYPYAMPIGKFLREQSIKNFAIIHDYAPLLCGTFLANILHPAEIKIIHQAPFNLYGRRVVLGVGTGLGLKDGMMLPNGDFWLGNNEMGHLGIAQPIDADKHLLARHTDLINFLQTQTETNTLPLSFEHILSGKGLVRLHQFLNRETEIQTPEQLGGLIQQKQAEETLAMFAWYLGLYIATVELSLMPDAGIWISGGVIQNHSGVVSMPEFKLGLQALPAYLKQREKIPKYLILDPKNVFFGGAYYGIKRILTSNPNHANSKYMLYQD